MQPCNLQNPESLVPSRALFALIAGVAETETEATTSGWLSKIKQTGLSGQANTRTRGHLAGPARVVGIGGDCGLGGVLWEGSRMAGCTRQWLHLVCNKFPFNLLNVFATVQSRC